MTITREQVADLQPGDVVRVSIEGPVKRVGDELRLPTGQTFVWPDGTVATWVADHTLTVISRAPRPLYVNHPRTEPVPGDVVRGAEQNWMHTWFWAEDGIWHSTADGLPIQGQMVRPLRLLVDGETGQVVP